MLALLGERREFVPPTDPDRAPIPFDTGRAREVIERVVTKSDWTNRTIQNKRAKGFAFYFCHRGYFAEVVDLSINGETIDIHKIWVAGDVGSQIINPLGAENQVRGAIIDGIGQAIAGQTVEFVDGAPQRFEHSR